MSAGIHMNLESKGSSTPQAQDIFILPAAIYGAGFVGMSVDHYDSLRNTLDTLLQLARIRYGNLDPELNRVFARADALLSDEHGVAK